MLKGKTDKLEPRTEVCFLVGYPRGTKSGLFYSQKDQKVIVSTNAWFLEEDYVMNHKPRNRIVLEGLRGDRPVQTSLIAIVQEETPQESVVDIPLPRRSRRIVETRVDAEPCSLTIDMSVAQPDEHDHDGLQESASAQRTIDSAQTQGVSRRSGRVIRQPLRYTLLGESIDRIPNELNTDPFNYDEALKDKDAELWQKAMKSEMQSMCSNQVWDLMEPPERIKPIGCKWIYKKKGGANGKVETFKARLVAKGFTQKEGIDYEETFSPVAMIKSIQILLSIAAHFNYEIWQMDVKNAFLNGHLEEYIYMMQLDGFIGKGQEHMLCKLKRSICGLKKASRSWNTL